MRESNIHTVDTKRGRIIPLTSHLVCPVLSIKHSENGIKEKKINKHD